MERIKSEPVLILGVVQATLALVTAFGLSLSAEQVAAIVSLSAAVLSVLVRGKVTPSRSIVEPQTMEEAFNLLTEGLDVVIDLDDEA